MESHHHQGGETFAHHTQHLHPAAHQMHMYQQQQHEAHLQQQQQQQHQHQQQQMIQQKSSHSQRNTSTIHHHSQLQQQQQQHQNQQQHHHHHQQPQQQLQHQVSRAQQMSHNHPLSSNNHSQRHSLVVQQNNSVTQINQVHNRHDRTGAATQNRAAGTNSPFHQQRFQPSGGAPPPSHLHHQLIPPTGSLHPSQHVGASFMRPHDGDLPLRILVQSDMVGAIIGRSGSTIKQITQLSKARIDVHREENLDQQEKVITISGTPESCSSACFKILEIIQNERAQINNGGSSNSLDDSSSAKQDNPDFSSEVTLKILAHNNLIGRLIGRNGVSIKKIMEQTSTKINVSMNSLTDCTHERTITILGNLEQVNQAELVISSKLRLAYQADVNSTLQAMNQQSYMFNSVPIPYMSGPYTQNPILSTLVNPQAGHAGHALSRTVPLGSHQSQMTGSQIYPGSSNYFSLYPNINGPHGHGLLNFNPSRGGLESERETVNIFIPNSMVGAIIGKAGSAIKEMISTSGASIKVAAAPTQSEVASLDQTQKEDNAASDQQQTDQPESRDGAASRQSESKAEEVTQENSNELSESSVPPQPVSRQSSSENNPSSRKVTIIGSPESQWSAQYLIYRKVAIENGKIDTSLMVEIQVPSQLVGKIIGKGGVNVKNIQKQTRTTIRLPDEKSNPTTTAAENDSVTCVQITGEFQCSQLAQRHIRNLIKESLHRRLVDSRQKGQQTGGVTKQNGKSNAQSNLNDNQHHHSDNENMSNTNDAHDESTSSNDKNSSTQNSMHLSDEHTTESSVSKKQSLKTNGQQDESQISSRDKPAEHVERTDHDENAVVGINNNTISKDLNTSEEVHIKKQTVNKRDVDDVTDNDLNSRHENLNVENGEKVIKTTATSYAKQSVIESSSNEPALVNNGNPK